MKSSLFIPVSALALAAPMSAIAAVFCLFLTPFAGAQEHKHEPQILQPEGDFDSETGSGYAVRSGVPVACGKLMVTNINPGFAPKLYQQLRGTEGNLFFSPYSISEAMGMVYVGANGNTATEIAKAMSFGVEAKSFSQHMDNLRRDVKANATSKGDKLNIANALCVTGSNPLQSYQDTVRTKFEAEIFKGRLEIINGWVKQKTEGQVESILEELSPNSACVLLNAVYFKGKWQFSFDPNETHEGRFHVTKDQQVDVKFMSQTSDFSITRSKNWVAVELPYQSSCSMVLLMPSKADGMKQLEDSLDEALLKQVADGLIADQLPTKRHGEITLVMPKFKIATRYDLVAPMQQLGMKDAFNMKQSDFTAMYEQRVAISQIVHKATLEVDEEGSVAAAATAVEQVVEKASAPKPEIRFDRPFIVMIRENKTNATLFMGRISDPTQ